MELLIQPPARYPDLFPVLNVLVSTPVFGLVWLWSIKSGIEVGWAVVGLGGGNPAAPRSNTNSQPASSPLTINVTNPTPKNTSPSRLIYHGDPGPQFSATDPSLSPLSFNRRISSPPAIPGPHRSEARDRTWSSTSSNSRTRGNLPTGSGWDRPPNPDRVERMGGGGDPPTQGLGLNLDGQGENLLDRKMGRSTGQSLGVSSTRKRVTDFPGNADGFPPPSS